jgi:hypothetical protein
MENYAGSFFANDAAPGVVIQRPREAKKMSDEARRNLREEWEQMYGGSQKSHKPAVLQEGMTVERITVPPNEAQFIESRQFQAKDVAARWYRVPLSLVGLSDTGMRNMEEESIRLVRFVLPIWAKKLETEATNKLVRGRRRFTRLDFNELLRGDIKTRGSFYRLLVDRGIYSVNEVREFEDLEPVEGGDFRMVPKNMVSLEDAAAGNAGASSNAPRPGRNETDGGEEGGDDNDRDPTRDPQQASLPGAGQIAQDYMPALADLCERLVRKEVNAAQRQAIKHAEDRERFEAWLERFYADHDQAIVEGLRAGCQTLARLTGSDGKAIDPALTTWAKREAAEAKRALHEAYLDGSVEQLVTDWHERRPSEMAHDLTSRLVLHQEPEDAAAE